MTWKVAVEAVTKNSLSDTMLTENAGGCVVNSLDSLLSPVVINSFCMAYTPTESI